MGATELQQQEEPLGETPEHAFSPPGRGNSSQIDLVDTWQLQWQLALHNCTSADLISPAISVPQIAVALCFMDRTSQGEARLCVIAASPTLFQRWPGLSLPQPLSDMVDSETNSCIAAISKLDDLRLYKKTGTKLSSGAAATVFQVPLSQVS